MSAAWPAAIALVLLAHVGAAVAEEGLAVARLGAGVATPGRDLSWAASLDLTTGQRAGVIVSSDLTQHDQGTTLGLGLGFKYLLIERMWKRVYVRLSPELVIAWHDHQDTSWDVAAGGALGYEQLLTWGLGVVVELRGTVPAGRGPAQPGDGASASATAGLFMEF